MTTREQAASDAVSIVPVSGGEDLLAVQDLVRGFMEWVRMRYADELWLVDGHYAPATVDTMIRDLADMHRPPEGCLLLARLDGRPAGCTMAQRFTPECAEMKRLFVADFARGHGLAARLCTQLRDETAGLGYSRLLLETGHRQTEAIALYDRLGFRRIDLYRSYDEAMASRMMAMELDLA